jgi:amino acid transporter
VARIAGFGAAVDHLGDGDFRARLHEFLSVERRACRICNARTGFFLNADGIHPKYRTPARSLIFQGILASLMALTGTFEELTNLFIFAGWIFYGFAVVALFRMRKTEPDLPRPYRCWGYPWVPGLFVAGALALTVNIWLQRPGRSSIGLLLILAGLPFYRKWAQGLQSNGRINSNP